jgi:hypothetical protein
MQIYRFFSFFPGSFNLPHCSCRGLLLHIITLNDKHTHSRTPLDEGSARSRKLCAVTYKQARTAGQSVSQQSIYSCLHLWSAQYDRWWRTIRLFKCLPHILFTVSCICCYKNFDLSIAVFSSTSCTFNPNICRFSTPLKPNEKCSLSSILVAALQTFKIYSCITA